jgi:capsular polysaccharide biosynthesis protein
MGNPGSGGPLYPPEVTPPRRVVVAMARDIETPTVAEAVIRRLGLRMTPDELLGNLTVEPDAQSSGIKLSYRDPARETPQRARKIVRAFVVVADEHIRVETPYDYAWVLG